ncbi:MAG: ATP-binding protein [Armatimonadota bacterium]|nr:ATP-binding protein [Armatimonadota bacterium]
MTTGMNTEPRESSRSGARHEHRALAGLFALLTLAMLCLLLFALYESGAATRQFSAVNMSDSLGYRSLWIYGVTHNAAMEQALNAARSPAAAPPTAPNTFAPPGTTPVTPIAPPTTGVGGLVAVPPTEPLPALPPSDTAGEDWQAMLASMAQIRSRLGRDYPQQVRAMDPAWNAFSQSLQNTGAVDWQTANAMRESSERLTDGIRAQARAQRQRASLFLLVSVLILIGALFLAVQALQRVRGVETALEQERRERDALLDSTGDGICATDTRGLCTYVNAAGAAMLGYYPSEMPGKNLHALLHHSRPDGSPLDPDADPLLHPLTTGETYRRDDDTFWRRDGTALPVSTIAAPIRANGGLQGAVITFSDIAERKELETLREDLNGMIVHDLRTPLTSLLTGLQTLAIVGKLDTEQQEFLDIATQGGQTLLGMINDLLDVSKMEAGSLKLEPAAVVPNDVISEALTQVAPMAQQNGLKIARHVAPDLPTLRADPDLVRRALINLLGNAVKFTPRGGIVTVAVFEDAAENAVVFAVGDTGEGIPALALQRIFDKFGQVETRKAGHKMSTGLGLTFCKLVAEAHGGRIWVESKLGKGSRFLFTIPHRPMQPAPLSLSTPTAVNS